MGLLSEDEGLIDAAVSEIVTLSIEDRHERDPSREVEKLLVNHYLAEVRNMRISSMPYQS